MTIFFLFKPGVLHEDLQLFLETNLPESPKKRKKLSLGVADSRIGAAIQEGMGFKCEAGSVVQEIHRGKATFVVLFSVFKGRFSVSKLAILFMIINSLAHLMLIHYCMDI